jgi:hypothetical protein
METAAVAITRTDEIIKIDLTIAGVRNFFFPQGCFIRNPARNPTLLGPEHMKIARRSIHSVKNENNIAPTKMAPTE